MGRGWCGIGLLVQRSKHGLGIWRIKYMTILWNAINGKQIDCLSKISSSITFKLKLLYWASYTRNHVLWRINSCIQTSVSRTNFIFFVSTWLTKLNTSSTAAVQGTTTLCVFREHAMQFVEAPHLRRCVAHWYQQVTRELVVYLGLWDVIPEWKKKCSGMNETSILCWLMITISSSSFDLSDASSIINLNSH